MTEGRIEKRKCERFVLAGATVYYRKKSRFLKRDFGKDFYPLFDISRGGLRFLSHDRMPVGTRVTIKIVQPEEEPLVMEGTVIWSGLHDGKSYKCEIGIQFAPYGEQEDYNHPEALRRITLWEERFGGNCQQS